jgi:hypothetical protein
VFEDLVKKLGLQAALQLRGADVAEAFAKGPNKAVLLGLKALSAPSDKGDDSDEHPKS